MRLLLIRHGETSDNEARRVGSRLPGPPLSSAGVAQADELARALVAERLDRVHASRALRAQQTAAAVARASGLPVEPVDGVHEIEAGDLEGLPYADAMPGYAGTMQRWWTDRHARIPGGEDGIEFMARYDRAIASIAAQAGAGSVVALVSHQAAITVWASSTASNLDAEFSRTHDLRNAGVVALEGSPAAGWRAVSWDGIAIRR